jgi:hypothetical protein
MSNFYVNQKNVHVLKNLLGLIFRRFTNPFWAWDGCQMTDVE